jgi:signal transduction histidine kinase
MDEEKLYERYRELQAYVGWTEEDGRRVASLGPIVEPWFRPLIDDFYEEIERHSDARKVITGGQAQIERLKGTLRQWVRELFEGQYDRDYVVRRWRVGWRHVEIGLDQVYTNVALSRLRLGLLRVIHEHATGDLGEIKLAVRALNRLLDLDLAIIEDAYQTEYMRRLQRSERLATLGEVAGGVAHELRNPLNVVKTSVYYLLNARNANAEKTAEHFRRIERNVELADSVISALSSFAKMPIPSLCPIPVDEMIHAALEANPTGDAIQTQVDCPADLPPALADSNQMRIVLGNLIRNARDAMPQGGQLTITARRAGDALELAFTDNGVGISPENLNRIMEPLYSTKARGLGLGLSIARSILEKNQGGLRVASEPGRGSTFTVRLVAAPTDGEVTS